MNGIEASPGCGWPFVCNRTSVVNDDPRCPAPPRQTEPPLEHACFLGRQAGLTCDASWDDPDPNACQRCEPGLECIHGVCVQHCDADLDCPCGRTCERGFCNGGCVPGEACAATQDRCGICFESQVDLPMPDDTMEPVTICQPTANVPNDEVCPDPPGDVRACEPTGCEVGERLVCQGRSCASIAGEGAPCDVDPCAVDLPRVCDFPLQCRTDTAGNPEGTCVLRPEGRTPGTDYHACSPRSENTRDGNACPFPLVCVGFEGEPAGLAGGCPPRPEGVAASVNGLCVPGRGVGEQCDASYETEPLRSSCVRCAPGLECVDGFCQARCGQSDDCPCEQVCNAGYCGPPCADEGSDCTVVEGICGTCDVGGSCAPMGSPVTEGCGMAGMDDDCDGAVDERVLELDCDGVDDDCDGSLDEDWSQDASLWALCSEDACPTATTLLPRPGHFECTPAGLTCVFEPGVDYCAAPGSHPNPFGPGELRCGGGPGEPCDETPCFLGLECIDGTCVGSPADASECAFAFWTPDAADESFPNCRPQRGEMCGW